jgi:DNA polymerase elongation subunit (family B)
VAPPKVLFFDIETAPMLAWVWRRFETNVIDVESQWYMLCWAAKWQGSKNVFTSALPDFENYKKDREDDLGVIQELWAVLDEADIVIGHNGDAFDIKKFNARALVHGLGPPSPYQTVDTLKVARRYFKFDSNKLDVLGDQLGVGRKVQTGGFSLWKGCMEGNPKAWAKMVRYNKRDVTLLEEVYNKLLPWMVTHPNLNVYSHGDGCPKCGSSRMKRNGCRVGRTAKSQQYKCLDCGGHAQGPIEKGTRVKIK